MKISIAPWQNPALALGLSCLLLDQAMNIIFMYEVEKGVTPLLLAVPLSGIASSACFPVARIAFQKGLYVSCLMLTTAFFCFALFSLGASLDRAGTNLDNKVSQAKAKNKPAELAQKAYNKAEKALDKAREISDAECATGRGKYCIAKEALVKKAKADFDLATLRLIQNSETKSVNSMASRVSFYLGISPETVNTIFPLLIPLGLWLGSIAFIAVGVVPETPKPKEDKSINDDLPLPIRVRRYMEENKTHTQKMCAKACGTSETTVSRILNGKFKVVA